LLGPEQGGHVAFLSANEQNGEDRFWAENRVVEFCKLANELFSETAVNEST
jgi:predicted alpha/beta-fold hydrolase